MLWKYIEIHAEIQWISCVNTGVYYHPYGFIIILKVMKMNYDSISRPKAAH